MPSTTSNFAFAGVCICRNKVMRVVTSMEVQVSQDVEQSEADPERRLVIFSACVNGSKVEYQPGWSTWPCAQPRPSGAEHSKAAAEERQHDKLSAPKRLLKKEACRPRNL